MKKLAKAHRRVARHVVRDIGIGLGMAIVAATLSLIPLPHLVVTTVAGVDRLTVAFTDAAGAQGLAGEAQAEGLEPFSALGIRNETAPTAPVEVRILDSGGWGPWVPLDFGEDGPDSLSAEGRQAASEGTVSDAVWTDAATGYQLRSTAPLGATVDVLLVRDHHTEVSVDLSEAPAGAQSPGYTYGMPSIHGRGDWGARAPSSSISTSPTTLNMGVVHHSETATAYAAEDVPRWLRSIQAYHMDARGWSDIGYNFAVDRFGGIWEARAGGVTQLPVGAHVGGFNTGTTGVVVLGSFVTDTPTSAAVNAVGDLLGWKMFAHRVDPSTQVTVTSGGSDSIPAGQVITRPRIVGHRDLDATGCPGANLYSQLNAIRFLAKARYDALVAASFPRGNIDAVQGGAATITANGWAWVPDNGNPALVTVSVDTDRRVDVTANANRPDAAGANPESRSNVGFSVSVSGLAAGDHVMCFDVRNPILGDSTRLGCRTVNVGFTGTGPPIGTLTAVGAGPGQATVSGWSLDPDSSGPVQVEVYGPGFSTVGVTADDPTAGLEAYGRGSAHGFSTTISGLSATTSVCARALNLAGSGGTTDLGCRSVTIPSGPPRGSVDYYQVGMGTVDVYGWAYDPDTVNSIGVYLYVDNATTAVWANTIRTDHASLMPGYGPNHGYHLRLDGISAGQHRLCVFAFNVGAGSNTTLFCTNAVVP